MWHVDDIKVSCVIKKAAGDFILWTKQHYENPSITTLDPQRGKVFDYLGITLDYTEKGKVKLYMTEYIDNLLDEFPHMHEVDELKNVTTPAVDHLFDVSDKSKPLNKGKYEEFHLPVMQLLFLTKRTHPDI